MGAFCPFAVRVFSLQLFVGLLELLGIMAALVPRDPPKEDSLRRGITLRIIRYNPIQVHQSIIEFVCIKMDFANAQKQ